MVSVSVERKVKKLLKKLVVIYTCYLFILYNIIIFYALFCILYSTVLLYTVYVLYD